MARRKRSSERERQVKLQTLRSVCKRVSVGTIAPRLRVDPLERRHSASSCSTRSTNRSHSPSRQHRHTDFASRPLQQLLPCSGNVLEYTTRPDSLTRDRCQIYGAGYDVSADDRTSPSDSTREMVLTRLNGLYGHRHTTPSKRALRYSQSVLIRSW